MGMKSHAVKAVAAAPTTARKRTKVVRSATWKKRPRISPPPSATPEDFGGVECRVEDFR